VSICRDNWVRFEINVQFSGLGLVMMSFTVLVLVPGIGSNWALANTAIPSLLDLAGEHPLMLLALQVGLIFVDITSHITTRIACQYVVIENTTCICTRTGSNDVRAISEHYDDNNESKT